MPFSLKGSEDEDSEANKSDEVKIGSDCVSRDTSKGVSVCTARPQPARGAAKWSN